jgi:5-methylthioribose kinase
MKIDEIWSTNVKFAGKSIARTFIGVTRRNRKLSLLEDFANFATREKVRNPVGVWKYF